MGWWIKRVVPRTLRTEYYDPRLDADVVCVWKMWLGRCYKIDRVRMTGRA